MLPLIMAGAGAGLGLLKSELIDKPNEQKDREMQSITDRYSPWTGMRGKMVAPTNALGSAMSFGAQGAALGQGVESMGQDQKFNDAMVKNLDAKTAFLGGAGQTAQAATQSGEVPAQALATPAPIQAPQANRSPINNPTEFDILGGGDSEVNADVGMQRIKAAYGASNSNRAAYLQALQGI